MGWCWYLLTVTPVLGIVQVGDQALADRYTYLPLVGVAIALAWGGALLWRRVPRARGALASAALVSLLVGAATTREQLTYWGTPELLFIRAAEVAPGNWKAQLLLGVTFDDQGRTAEAERRYREALRLNPQSTEAHFCLGALLLETGRTEEAIPHLRDAVRAEPVPPIARHYYETARYRLMQERGTGGDVLPLTEETPR
jgi:tetratricopeptide (TPR) repeat protein